MFEKSLYDLIRGLRNHKGNERTYIQNSLKECRAEIKSQDMDVKATALLKLVYLEMFGHDMSWASFHVLEVMSSQKYLQKRVGYLGAVQSFGPNTDVLMLATNLLKKDLTSSQPTTISLPLITIPHIITPSLALSLLSDLLPRLTHSHATIRKKTIVTLYRLALVYPETLRPAWPKIKERLMDENEEMTVTVTIVNVVCELAWRRPQDFLPLAPRLFSLLVDAGNNWMAIKIIKLFATLTPLEPRLVRKLLPPLTSLIKTTPAMSLLYECVNGIIQGGILESSEGTNEGEEIASLCVGKLRGMIVSAGDRNLKYVALLAFNKIVVSHPHLVSMHQDVILDCIDDADISIRLRALDLVVSMVNSENLVSVVERLMRQLRTSPIASNADDVMHDRFPELGVVPAADSDDEDPEEKLNQSEKESSQLPPLPEEYRLDVIQKVLEMCSRETYGNIVDFEWYLDILVQLVRLAPSPSASTASGLLSYGTTSGEHHAPSDMSERIGDELLNVAVRVKSVRAAATRAAETMLLSGATNSGSRGALSASAWIAGEYAALLAHPDDTLTALLQPSSASLPAETIAAYLQAVPKVFASLTSDDRSLWTNERKTMTSLVIARIIHFLEPLSSHPSLEVQERSVEFLELMRLVAESVSGQPTTTADEEVQSVPLMLTQVVPSLFSGQELNPVAPGAQRKVPLPDDLDLDTPINKDLQALLQTSDLDVMNDVEDEEFHHFYYERETARVSITPEPASNRLGMPPMTTSSSYQSDENVPQDPGVVAKRLAERREKNKDDPFYILDEGAGTGGSTPIHNILKDSNGEDLDMDSIPIMNLDLGSKDRTGLAEVPQTEARAQPTKRRKKVAIIGDETIAFPEESMSDHTPKEGTSLGNGITVSRSKGAKSILQVDSSGLGKFSFAGDEESDDKAVRDARQREEEELEMARAMKEVERARLEMQRAADRIQAVKGVPPEGTLVKRKKKKVKRVVVADEAADHPEKGTAQPASGEPAGEGDGVAVVKKKVKKVKTGTKKKKQESATGEVEDDPSVGAETNVAGTGAVEGP